jgi:hypothetical protein
LGTQEEKWRWGAFPPFLTVSKWDKKWKIKVSKSKPENITRVPGQTLPKQELTTCIKISPDVP